MKLNELPLVVSFSGGRTSAFMTKYLVDKYKCAPRELAVCFANTGMEREETLQFVHECDTRWGLNVVWIEADINTEYGKGTGFKVVDFATASRNGEPFEAMIKKYGIPNKAFPHCSRELKTVPIKKFSQSLWGKYQTAIGIRYDELHRIPDMKDGREYPLVFDCPVNKEYVNRWWANQPFNLNLKPHEGNCTLCWKKSKRKLLTLLVERPQDAGWWIEMENRYSMFQPKKISKGGNGGGPPYYFFRENTSIFELIEDSKFPFSKWQEQNELQMAMFSEPELDFSDGCETCEI